MSHVQVPARLLVTPPAAFADAAALWIAAKIAQAVAERKTCALALSGGSTPGPVYRRLARQQVRWAQTEIFFADERSVPHDHPESNARLVDETLLQHLPDPPVAIWRMEPGPAGALAYEHVLPARLDVVVLGMGRDGHTASLFPGASSVDEESRRAAAVPGPPGGRARVTLTPLALHAARERVVLVRGADKADILAEVLDAPVDRRRRPAQLVLDGTWIVDRDAARGILGRP